jgi:FeS assembly protein SufB
MSTKQVINEDYSKYDFKDPESYYVFKSQKGLAKSVVEEISKIKKEPEWMTKFRLRSYEVFMKKPMPNWGGDLSTVSFDDIYYYARPTDKKGRSWDEVPEAIKRTFDKLGIPEAERKFLGGVGAQYECLSHSTRVYTARGLVPIKDVKIGDIVFSFNEITRSIIPATVLGVQYKGDRPVFEVETERFRIIRATANHPFLVLRRYLTPGRRGEYRMEWKYLFELHEGDLIACAKQLPEIGSPHQLEQPVIQTVASSHNQYLLFDSHPYTQLPQSTSKDLMWWLGVYMGGGFIHKEGSTDKARVEFAIPRAEKAFHNSFVESTKQLFGLKATSTDGCKVTVSSAVLASFLEVNGFAGATHTKRVPRWVFSLPRDQILSFLGGFVDSDGYVVDSGLNYGLVVTGCSKELLQDMKELANLCGIPTSDVVEFKKPLNPLLQGFKLSLYGNYDSLNCKNPTRLSKFLKGKEVQGWGRNRHSENPEYGFVEIKQIREAGIEPVYDIEVDGPHNFVAEGLIVHNSEVVYHSLRKDLESKGVVFLDTDTAVQKYPDIVKRYFGTIIPPEDNKFSALNSAVWSGGSFVYVPEGVKVEVPLQAYFRINAENIGQFERTLIIAEPHSEVHYIEGCTAPVYSTDSLHSAVVEIIAKKGAHVRYTTIQNWSKDVYNLVTKRAYAYEDAFVEWVDGNLGSKLTMKYPSVYLVGPRARGEVLSVAFAGNHQHQDSGAKIVHLAPNTTSRITAKSVSKDGGRTTYRGLLHVARGAKGVKSSVRCDALLLDDYSRTDTYPYNEINEDTANITHEATVGKISEDQLFYLMSRGLTESEALNMIVMGFLEPFAKELPMEYAVELNRLIQLEMAGAVG